MLIPECGVRLMVADLAIIRKHARKLVRVSRELAALRKLEQMQSVRMLEQRATWMRKNGFDRIKVISDRPKETLRRTCEDFDPEPFNN